jgi:hypothetical protein
MKCNRTLWETACFDPGTLAIGSLIAGGIGAATSAVGALTQGQAAANTANYQAQVARNNAITASQNAAYASQSGEAQATNASLRARAEQGQARAALAAGGVDVNTGSAADVQTTARELGDVSTQTVAQNAALQAYGYRTQATGYTATAQLESAAAAEAPIEGAFSAGGDLLSGASSVGSKWAQFQNAGVSGF